MFQNPFADLIPGQHAQTLPTVIEGPPREPPPQTPGQAEGDALQNDLRAEQIRRMRLGTPPAGMRFNDAGELEPIPGAPVPPPAAAAQAQRQRNANLDALANQINRVQELYEQGIRGQGLGSVLEYLPDWASDTNAQFNSAAAGVSEQGLAAFRVPGVGSQSDAELRQFVAANRPEASDRDVQIEEKLRQLRARVDATREAMGLPPAQWRSAEGPPGRAPPGTELRFNDEIPEEPVNPLSSEQQRAWDSFIAANPRANADQLRGFFQSLGIDPARVNIEEMARAYEAGAPPRSAEDARFNIDISDARGGGGLPETLDAAMRGIADIPTFGFADEISAAGDTLFSGGTMAENLARQRAIDEYDTENNFAARMGGQLAGGFLVPSRVAATARGAARNALRSGEGRAGAQMAGRQAATRQLTREGATFGGLYGVGSTEGDIGDRLAGGALSATIGAGAANALGRAGGAIAGRNQTPNALARHADRVEAAEAAQAATDLGIEMLPADLGGAGTRMATAISRQTPGGVIPITAGARRVTRQAEAARSRIAANVGQVVEPEAAGQAGTRGAQASRRATGQQGRRLYRQAQQMAEGVDVTPQNTMQTIARLIREEGQVPGGTDALPVLQHYASAFEGGGPITIEGARGMRTALRQRLTAGNMAPGNADRITSEIMDAVGQDVTAALTSAGRQDAVRAYRQADDFWRERLDTIHNVLEPIIGRRGERSGEDVMRALLQDGRGNSVRLGRFIETLPAEEAATVRATLIQQLGRSNPGAQNAEGTAFSLNTFLTHWNALQPGARRALFDDDTRAALTRLARVANRSRQSQAFSNFSNTGSVVSGVAQVGHFFTEPVSATLSLAGQYGVGMLLANPRFARWLARMPENPRQIRSHVTRLDRIAATQPAIAADVTGLRDAILTQIGESGQ